jgi:hypothetical protein
MKLEPQICKCGCQQPVFDGDCIFDGVIFNHTRNLERPSYIIKDAGYKTPCWLWQGPKNVWGYGKIKRNRSTQGAHRLFYRAYVNPVLPKSRPGSNGLDHLCKIRHCVNPDHLRPMTCAENIRCGKTAKLSLGQVKQIRLRALSGENQRLIASHFKITQSQVSRIKLGMRWSTSMMK